MTPTSYYSLPNKLCVITILFSILLCQIINPQAARSEQAVLRVALFVGKGASDRAKRNFRRLLGSSDAIRYQSIFGEDIAEGSLKDFDALVVPGGSAAKEAVSMGPEARSEVRRFIEEGGVYLGVCAGAYLATRLRENYLGFLPLKTRDPEHWYRVDDATPVEVELTQEGAEVFGLDTCKLKIAYENGPIFGPPEIPVSDSFKPLGFFRSEVVGSGGERGVMLDAPAMILTRHGRGLVLAISPHPELTPGRHKMILNALSWLCDHRGQDRRKQAHNCPNERSRAEIKPQ